MGQEWRGQGTALACTHNATVRDEGNTESRAEANQDPRGRAIGQQAPAADHCSGS